MSTVDEGTGVGHRLPEGWGRGRVGHSLGLLGSLGRRLDDVESVVFFLFSSRILISCGGYHYSQ